MTWTSWALVGMGAGHGANPGMGWLFAVALGMQERRARAVWRALPPLAAGHALAVGLAALSLAALGRLVPAAAIHWIIGGSLLALGGARLASHRHPRYGGMRVGFRELTTWSFLMATGHGAGLMVLPLLVGAAGSGASAGEHGHMMHAVYAAQASLVPSSGLTAAGLWATLAHTAGYLLVTGLIALTVYRKFGLRLLRTMWINLDLIWGGALLGTGALTLIL
ncbi:MAG: hypothetical protein ACTHM9_05105 [Gemmatimonadales bacterium]